MMRLAEIWRYPVKSLQGEQLSEALVEKDGLHGDRRWGIRDEATGKILTGRREPQLLLASATLAESGVPDIMLPDGRRCRGVSPESDEVLSSWLGKRVTLVEASRAFRGKAEFYADATDESSAAIEWLMPPGRFVDAMPLLVLTTASLRAGAAAYPSGDWNVRRFRPNLLVDTDADGWVEDDWADRTLRVRDAEFMPRKRCERCTMVTRVQPGIERDLDIYKTLSRQHAATLGMWTRVQAPGTIRIGDVIDLVS